jgi:aspartate racemase
VKHLGILAHSVEGASLCLRTFCMDGFRHLGSHLHPDVSLDCIAMGHSMPAWDAGDMPPIASILATSASRLRAAGADFFVCPDNTAHMALETAREPLALPGLHIAEIVAERAARDDRRTVGILGRGTPWTQTCTRTLSGARASSPWSRRRTSAPW